MLTADGYRQIKDIQEGDLVYSENVETGEKGLKRVSKVFVREIKKLVHVYVDGEEIKTTDTHPFWVERKGWIKAGELAGGDVLRLYTGELKIVDKVEIEVFDKAVKVYNFEVEDWHTYYVSDEAVLVHNAKNYNQKGNKGGKGNNSGKGNTSKGTNTNKAAEDLGYTKTNYRSHGQPVYKNGNKYITQDVDGHNGGAWKMADSIKNLGSKSTRMGTYDANLNRIGD